MVKLCQLACVLTLVRRALSSGPIAETEYGKVQGHSNGGVFKRATVDAFKGIPYAAPPIGDNRFRPPQPFTESWSPKIRSATELGNICAQMDLTQGVFFGSEDCLYLNVFRPSGAKNGSDIPVIVWIYGGGFIIGDGVHVAAGQLPLYDPTNIVEQHGHVFVSMNYRLSGFGFFALPELAAEHSTGSTGNYGLQDQRAAMQWVQRNIMAFGGDPSKVTIQGESAGAISVVFHLVSPASKGLFRSAIEESGTLMQNCFWQNRTDAFKFNKDWAAIQGCNTSGPELLSCLRKLPAKHFLVGDGQIVKDWVARLTHSKLPSDIPDWACPLFPATAWGALVDGSPDGLPDWPLSLLTKGEFNKVPLITGGNINGGVMFTWLFPLLWGALPYPAEPRDTLQDIADWFLSQSKDRHDFMQLYGGPDWGKAKTIDRTNRFWRDSFFLCPSRETAVQFSLHNTPVYSYVFSFDMIANTSRVMHAIDATHGFELPFVFRNGMQLGYMFLEPKAWKDMSNVMSCTWASFVKCQKPKCPADEVPPNCQDILSAVPDWPAFSAQSRQYMSFKKHTSVGSIKSHTDFPNDEYPGDDRCDFWKGVDWSWTGIRRWPKYNGSESDLAAGMQKQLQWKFWTKPNQTIVI